MNRCAFGAACTALLAVAAGLSADVAVNDNTSIQQGNKNVQRAMTDGEVPAPQPQGGVAGGIGVVCVETGTPTQCQLPDQSNARTSDVQALFKVAERFRNGTGAAASITKLCWWGIYIDFGATPDADCSADPANTVDLFKVTFFNNNATATGCPNSLPGSIKATYSQPALVVTKAATGNMLGSFIEFEYTATLSPAVSVANNECVFVEIQNDSTGTVSPNCVWLWSTAPGAADTPPGNGDDFAVQDTNSDGDYNDALDVIPDDPALCVNMVLGTTPACNFVPLAACIGAAGDCGAAHANPGCDDVCCCSKVCASLPLCCITGWTQGCANNAIGLGCATAPYACTAPAYANDCCTSPMTVTDGQNVAFNNTGANSDGAPEGNATDCIPNGLVGTDLWYKFVAAEPGTLVVSTCQSCGTPPCASFDTTLEIYDVGNGTYNCQDIKDQIGLVGCNDDGGLVLPPGQGGLPQCDLTSHVMAVTTSLLTAPRTYLIRLGGFDSAVGTGNIKFNFTPGVDLYDPGLQEPVIFNGTANVLVGFSSGNLAPGNPALPQRRAAQAFTLAPQGGSWKVTQLWANGFYPGTATNTTLTFEVFNRTALNVAPGPVDVVASGTLTYPISFTEPTSNLADTFIRHVITPPAFSLAPGNYWLTLYAGNGSPGVIESQFAWFTNAPNGINNVCPLLPAGCGGNMGCVGQPGGTQAMWRSCTYPVPGFVAYYTAAIAIDPVNDPTPVPADLFNTSFKVRGKPCPWDCGDRNGSVGIVDFLALLAQWGLVGTNCDINGGGVNVTDFLELLAHWGPC